MGGFPCSECVDFPTPKTRSRRKGETPFLHPILTPFVVVNCPTGAHASPKSWSAFQDPKPTGPAKDACDRTPAWESVRPTLIFARKRHLLTFFRLPGKIRQKIGTSRVRHMAERGRYLTAARDSVFCDRPWQKTDTIMPISRCAPLDQEARMHFIARPRKSIWLLASGDGKRNPSPRISGRATE